MHETPAINVQYNNLECWAIYQSCNDVTSDTPNVSPCHSGDKAALWSNYEQDHLYCRRRLKRVYNLNLYPADTTFPAIQREGVQSWV
jgi:hypothetical protein